jgi:cation diffusion facilitator family transporter
MPELQRTKRRQSVALLSVCSNTLLIVLKVAVGLLIGSVSVISEAIHSGVDLLAAVIAFFAVRKADQPPDESHPFGHGKFENISGAVEALLIFAAGGWIILESVDKLLHPAPLQAVSWGVGVMAVSAIVNLFVSRSLFRVGRETQSIALLADAWHLRTDIYTSAGVMLGLALISLGERLWPGTPLHWIDPVTAIAVAVLILRAAYSLTVQSARDLVDSSLPPEEERWIRRSIEEFVSRGVKGCHRLRTRKSGADRFVEFHMLVDPEMSVRDSHQLAEQLSKRIETHFAQTNVLVHVEPCDGSCPDHCLEGCLVPEQERGEKKESEER